MAVDYSPYTQQAGNQPDMSGLGAAIAEKIPTTQDKLISAANRSLNKSLSPLLDMFSKDEIKDWNNLTSIPSMGKAYTNWKKGLNRRQQKVLERSGTMSAGQFAQQYNEQMGQLMPAILNKLEAYRKINNLGSSDMRDLFKDKPGLTQYLYEHLSPEQRMSYSYLWPEQTWGQWWQGKSPFEKVLGPPVTIGAGARIAQRARQIKAKGLKPALFGGKKGFGISPSKTFTPKVGKALGLGKGLEKKYTKGIKSAAAKQSAATRALNKAKLKYDKKPTKYKKGKLKGKAIPWEKTKKYTQLDKARKLAKGVTTTAKAKTGTGAAKVVTRYVKKHGVSGLIKQLAKKLGPKGAAKLVAKAGLGTALTFTGVGTAAGIALDVASVWQIARALKDITSEENL